jgi:NTP pyrophosphatase (non-canonical NTP hydrolase)
MTDQQDSTPTPLNYIGDTTLAWANSVGWGHHTILEDLALLASEVGELVNECRGPNVSDEAFASELADVILRTLGIARKYGVDADAAVLAKMRENTRRGNRGRLK